MSGSVFLPIGMSATCPINFMWDHPEPGVVPVGVVVTAAPEGVVDVALAEDGRSWRVTGVATGNATVKTACGDKSDEIMVQVGEPILAGLVTAAAQMVREPIAAEAVAQLPSSGSRRRSQAADDAGSE